VTQPGATRSRRAFYLRFGALALLGVGLRAWLLARYPGDPFDLNSALLMRKGVLHHGLHAYSYANPTARLHYPYPPGWLPVILAGVSIAHAVGASVGDLLRAPLIVVDVALAWVVQAILAWTGRSDNERLAGAALILLGPPIFATTILQGQLDTVSALAILGAVAAWLRVDPRRRWLAAGVLIGTGATVKTTPIFAVLALLPTAVSRRERLKLAVVAVAIPVASLLPFAIADPGAMRRLAGYHGAPGAGGLSLLVQPRLALDWLSAPVVAISGANHALDHAATWLAVAAVAIVAATSWRARLDPLTAGVLVYAALLLGGVDFFLQYIVWLLPLIVAWGRLRIAAAITAIWTVPLLFRYANTLHWHTGTWSRATVLGVYVPVMDALYVTTLIATVWLALRVRRRSSRG
jgi:hypothetical protein